MPRTRAKNDQPSQAAREQTMDWPQNGEVGDGMGSSSEMSECIVLGRTLVPMGKVAGRMVYVLTSHRETWRFTPDIQGAYLLRRLTDGSYRECPSLEAAVAYVDAIEHQPEEY